MRPYREGIPTTPTNCCDIVNIQFCCTLKSVSHKRPEPFDDIGPCKSVARKYANIKLRNPETDNVHCTEGNLYIIIQQIKRKSVSDT